MKPTQIWPTHKESAPGSYWPGGSVGSRICLNILEMRKFSWVIQTTADRSNLVPTDCSAPFHPLILISTTSSTTLWYSLCSAVDTYMCGQEIPCWSRCPCNLRCRSATTRLLGLWVEIPLKAWKFMSCVCCVLRRFKGGCVCVCLIVCDLETSTMRWPRPKLGCCSTENKNSLLWKPHIHQNNHKY